jgi:hypothetical protein
VREIVNFRSCAQQVVGREFRFGFFRSSQPNGPRAEIPSGLIAPGFLPDIQTVCPTISLTFFYAFARDSSGLSSSCASGGTCPASINYLAPRPALPWEVVVPESCTERFPAPALIMKGTGAQFDTELRLVRFGADRRRAVARGDDD